MSGYFGCKFMKYWLKTPVFTLKVGKLSKFRNLTDLATWNPGNI